MARFIHDLLFWIFVATHPRAARALFRGASVTRHNAAVTKRYREAHEADRLDRIKHPAKYRGK